jgi:hypothetical protein
MGAKNSLGLPTRVTSWCFPAQTESPLRKKKKSKTFCIENLGNLGWETVGTISNGWMKILNLQQIHTWGEMLPYGGHYCNLKSPPCGLWGCVLKTTKIPIQTTLGKCWSGKHFNTHHCITVHLLYEWWWLKIGTSDGLDNGVVLFLTKPDENTQQSQQLVLYRLELCWS